MTTSFPLLAPEQGQQLRLGAAQSLMLQVPAGSTVVTTSGCLLLTAAPRWLGERVCRAQMPLEPGQAHAVEDDGWITLTAGPQGGAACLLPSGKLACFPFPWLAALCHSLPRLTRTGTRRVKAV